MSRQRYRTIVADPLSPECACSDPRQWRCPVALCDHYVGSHDWHLQRDERVEQCGRCGERRTA